MLISTIKHSQDVDIFSQNQLPILADVLYIEKPKRAGGNRWYILRADGKEMLTGFDSEGLPVYKDHDFSVSKPIIYMSYVRAIFAATHYGGQEAKRYKGLRKE